MGYFGCWSGWQSFREQFAESDESPDGSALRRPLFKKMIPAVDLPFFLSGVIVY